ncbi:MAG: hypothetical protein ACREN1_07645 [Candidatus Dormibacteria bacterium]
MTADPSAALYRVPTWARAPKGPALAEAAHAAEKAEMALRDPAWSVEASRIRLGAEDGPSAFRDVFAAAALAATASVPDGR